MSEDLFLQLLMKYSPARLRELRVEADEKATQGTRERDYIDRALALKESPDAEPSRLPARRVHPKTGLRERIKQIVASDATHAWMPAEVRDQLLGRFGIEATPGTIRATMKRLLDDGEFARPYEGGHGFKLASANGSQEEPPTEATSSAPGGYGRPNALAPIDGLGQ